MQKAKASQHPSLAPHALRFTVGSTMKAIRLQKVIAQAGLASRRAAEVMIREGRVMVNGRIVTELGSCVDPERDEIRVDRKLISIVHETIYLLLYKPRFCVTTLSDPQGRKTVMSFFPNLRERVFPVGRLDFDAEGLLLLTNDGSLAHRLQHPRYGVSKTYEVEVKGHPDDQALKRLRSGVILEEGKTAPADVEMINRFPETSRLRIVLHQGWNRQIKRMCEAVGHPVVKIKRVAYGFLELEKLRPGQFRSLTSREVQRLYQTVRLDKEKPHGNEQKRE